MRATIDSFDKKWREQHLAQQDALRWRVWGEVSFHSLFLSHQSQVNPGIPFLNPTPAAAAASLLQFVWRIELSRVIAGSLAL